MAQCKLNKINIVCEKYKRNNIKSEQAMRDIQAIVDLKVSESPACTCMPEKDAASPCPLEQEKISEKSGSCPNDEKSGSCHAPGPMTINPFFNFMKELRETTCFNKTVVDISKEAAHRWSKMSDCDKAPYIVEAYKVSRKKGTSMKRENSDGESCGPKSKVKKSKKE